MFNATQARAETAPSCWELFMYSPVIMARFDYHPVQGSPVTKESQPGIVDAERIDCLDFLRMSAKALIRLLSTLRHRGERGIHVSFQCTAK